MLLHCQNPAASRTQDGVVVVVDNTALLNPKMTIFNQKRHPYTGEMFEGRHEMPT